jgi:hypothetical protein
MEGVVDEGRFLALGAALAAAAMLLFGPAAGQPPQQPPPPTVAQLWPAAQRGTVPADLADGTAYEPSLFLDARNSIGTALSPDGKYLRLILRRATGSIRELRRVPVAQNTTFESPTAAGNVLVWAENAHGGDQLWTADLRADRPAHRLTADAGDTRFYQSQYDLVIAQGRVHWVAAASRTATEVRSVALTGGPVQVRLEQGTWALSAWPWLVDGQDDIAGTSRLRNVVTGNERAVPLTLGGATACSPAWCQVVSLDDGYPQIELVRLNGTDRRRVAVGTAATVIADVAVLDRFEVFTQVTAMSQLTGKYQLLIYDINTHRTVEVSPDTGSASYRAGVLWWSTGSQDSFLRHTLDLRTV